MTTQADVRALVETRVRVTLKAPGEVSVEGILRALTPADVLVVSDSRGHLTTVPFGLVEGVDDARFTCAECGRASNTTYEGERCADCYREWCQKQPAPSELCESCGSPGAVYSPKHKFWRCRQCHAKDGTFTGSGPELRVLTAVCRSDDKDSSRHDWRRVKSQWVCKGCQVKVFGTKPAGAPY